MVEFINANGAKGEIEKILIKAKDNVVMISPYSKISDDLLSRLNDAGERNVKIMMICRGSDLVAEERVKLAKIPNLVLKFNERVHAKCFYDDESMVITSLNLYKSSLGDNMEMGVILRNDVEGDKIAFQQAKSEAQFIIRDSVTEMSRTKTSIHDKPQTVRESDESGSKYETKPGKENNPENSIIQGISKFFGFSEKQNEGHCIRCGDIIPFNVDAPYCPKHYKTWARYKDPTYLEKFCHKCGHEVTTTKKSPLCTNCRK
jgi:hypothetical protein